MSRNDDDDDAVSLGPRAGLFSRSPTPHMLLSLAISLQVANFDRVKGTGASERELKAAFGEEQKAARKIFGVLKPKKTKQPTN